MRTVSFCVLCLAIASLTAAAQDLDQGIDQYRRDNYADAASTLKKVVDQDAGNARANLYLGLALVEQGKIGEGEPLILKADELSPSGETKTGKARLYVAKKDYSGAEDALKEADGEYVPYVRGLLELDRKQFADAARDLEQFIDSHSDSAYAHYWAGLAYNGMKRPDKMLTHFEIFLRMKPDAPEARKVRTVVGAAR